MKRLSLATVVAVVAVSSAYAQEQGQITGIVTDSTGAIVPGSTVTARNIATNEMRNAPVNTSGEFTFTNLRPATYEVTVPAANGLSAYKAVVEITVGGRLTLSIKLVPTSSTTTVEVTADAGAQVNTQTQELSQVISPEQVSQLPSLTRNPYDFIALSGNVSSGDAGSNNAAQNATTRGVGFGLNGGRSSGTEILLDGVENISVFGNAVGVRVPIDSVQEYRIITSNFEPQYGRASGGVVNVSTKSGSNAFHGTVYEFNRLSNYTANTVYNAQNGLAKGHYTRNQFGGAVGGPIIKDKLFFFGDAEFTRVRSAAVSNSLIPTTQFLAQAPANVQSFFSAYGANAPTSNNLVTNSQLGTNAYANLAPSFPVFQKITFNTPEDAGGGLPQNTYNVFGRVDYNLSSRTQAFFRYANYHEIDQAGAAFASPYAQYNVGEASQAQAYLLSIAHEYNASISSITKLSFSRINNSNSFNTSLQNVPTLFISANAQIAGTNVQLPGFYDQNPANGGLPYGGPANTIQYNQDLDALHGRHTMQFGGQVLYIQENQSYGAYAQASEQLGKNLSSGIAALESGSLFQFSAAVNPNGKLPCVRSDQYTGALNQTPGCTISLPASSPSFARSDRFHDWAAYGQDNWKATTRMTLNYGLRYEYFGVQHNNNPNLDSNFYFGAGSSLPSQIRSGQVFTSPNSPTHGLWKPQYGTVSPRLGFAYDVFGTGRTSIRGGYGISYERNFGNVTFNLIQNPPNYAVIVLNNSATTPLFVTNSNLGPLAGGAGVAAPPLPPTSLRNVSQNIRTAQTQFYSLSVGQQLAPNTVVDFEYSGSRGTHLYDIKNYNGLGSGNALLGDSVTDPANPAIQGLTRLNPQYSNINNRGSGGDSYYQAFNIQFTTTNIRHTNLSLVANYTLAHSIDDLSTTFSESNNAFSLGYTNPFNPALDRGPSDFDIRNRLVLAPIYRTPSYHGGKGLLAELISGYQVTGIYTVHTGTPFTFFDSTNNASGYNIARYTPAAGVVPQHTFKKIPANTSFNAGTPDFYTVGTLPAANSFGNPALLGISDWGPFPATMTSRNAFRGPGLWGFDASFSKTFPIHEHVNVELRAEGFNILNHHNLFIQQGLNDVANYAPDPITIIASKGGIQNANGASDERRFGQFAAKLNF